MTSYPVYEPQEDSYLLQKEIQKLKPTGIVCEIGCGSGIQSIELAKTAEKVYAIDINQNAIDYTNKEIEKSTIKNITTIKSNLFDFQKELKDKILFDLIIFNPPYLPNDPDYYDPALDGGEEGYEVTVEFLKQAKNFLKEKGKILLLFSNLTKKPIIDNTLNSLELFYNKIQEKYVGGFETLYIYLISKENIPNLEIENLTIESYLAKGKRGYVYKGKYENKDCVIKIKNPNAAVDTLDNEAHYNKLLNKFNIGPQFYTYTKGAFIREYLEGERIGDFLLTSSKEDALDIIFQVLKQTFTMDQEKINKYEMTNPYKHILITKEKKAVQIDFERCKISQKIKNTTQFLQYITSNYLLKILNEKNLNIEKDKIRQLSSKYKKDMTKENYNEIIEYIKSC